MIDGLLLAFQFLTRIPINKNIDFSKENLSKAINFFPVVGIVIGLASSLTYSLFSKLSTDIASFLAMLTILILTGGLHIDGLADSFDGFFSNRDREKTLEIMSDSRIGVFGVIAIVINILFKYIIIKNLTRDIPVVLALALGNSRLITSYVMAFKKSAKPTGLGKMFNESKPYKNFLITAIIYIIIIIFINPIYLIPLLVNYLLSIYISYVSNKKIGGYTGDVYGLLIELGDSISLLSFLGVIECVL